MLRRAIICVLLTQVGALAASGAMLNPEQRNAAFQPGGSGKFKHAVVLKPAQAAMPVAQWGGVKVERITPSAQARAGVEIGTRSVTKAQDAVIMPGAVRQAGGAR